MAATFDATLKHMGRDSPGGFLAAFDRPASVPFRLLNVDLSTVTTTADLIVGLGERLRPPAGKRFWIPLEAVCVRSVKSKSSGMAHASSLRMACDGTRTRPDSRACERPLRSKDIQKAFPIEPVRPAG